MLWVLAALVLMIVALLLHFLKQIMAAVAKNRYYPPSDAFIDQVLPEEVLEHILSYADPLAVVYCQSVSKYWRSHASKKRIKLQVLKTAINEVRNLPDVKSNIRDIKRWTEYPEGEKIEQRLADFALAQRHNKYLLDIIAKFSIWDIRELMHPDKYAIKTVGKLVNYPTFDIANFGHVTFHNGSAFESVVHNKTPSYHSNELYEIVAPLDQCLHHTEPREMLMCRPIKQIDSAQDENIQSLIQDLSVNQINAFLRSKKDDTTMLEYVFTTRSKEIAFLLLTKSQPKYIHADNEFSWYKLFDRLESFLLSQRNRKNKIPAKRLASKLHFLSRYNQDIDLQSLILRPKFFAAALLLGATFNSTQQSIAEFVLESNLPVNPEKKNLISWLLDNKFIENNSISVKIFAKTLQGGGSFITKLLIKHFPSLLEDVDADGCNVMHYCVPGPVRVRRFAQCLKFMLSNVTSEQLYKLLTARSNDYTIPVITAFRHIYGRSNMIMPLEIMNVLAQLARDNKEDILSQIYDGANWMKRKFLFNRYLLQYGMKMDMALFTTRYDVTRASQLLWSVKLSQKSVQNEQDLAKDTKLTSPNHISEISSEILSLPKDILLLILLELRPADLSHFSITCKFTMEFLGNEQSTQNERFCRGYYERQYKSIGCNWQGQSYKAKFVQETKGLANWRNKKFTVATVIDDFEPYLMDENWLLMMNSGNSNFLYWNCHTQQLVRSQTKSTVLYTKPLLIIGKYSHGALPPILYAACSAYRGGTKVTIRTSNDENFAPRNINQLLADHIPTITAIGIDHRVLVTSAGLLYDTEVDKFIGPTDFQVGSSKSPCCVNLFNQTFMKRRDQYLEIYNYQYDLLTKIPSPGADYATLQAVDENTIFYQQFTTELYSGYIDLRTGKVLWSDPGLLPEISAGAISSTRFVFKDNSTELLASFHLPSQKFEWIYPSEIRASNDYTRSNSYNSNVPVTINSRYLANRTRNKTILFDFGSDL